MDKVCLSSKSVVGGLNRFEQFYHFFYLPEESDVGLSSKIELAIVLKDSGVQKEYSSLRFESMAQFKGFLNDDRVRKCVKYLTERSIIDAFRYNYNQVVYSINLQTYKEALK